MDLSVQGKPVSIPLPSKTQIHMTQQFCLALPVRNTGLPCTLGRLSLYEILAFPVPPNIEAREQEKTGELQYRRSTRQGKPGRADHKK